LKNALLRSETEQTHNKQVGAPSLVASMAAAAAAATRVEASDDDDDVELLFTAVEMRRRRIMWRAMKSTAMIPRLVIYVLVANRQQTNAEAKAGVEPFERDAKNVSASRDPVEEQGQPVVQLAEVPSMRTTLPVLDEGRQEQADGGENQSSEADVERGECSHDATFGASGIQGARLDEARRIRPRAVEEINMDVEGFALMHEQFQ
jgi:hypothetical protein